MSEVIYDPMHTFIICPKCGANQELLAEMLADKPGSDNWETAKKIVENCSYCREALQIKIY